jgi:hypothetical protein
MAKAEFTKGQKVNVYTVDHHTAAVRVESFVVASCGLKQLHLVCDDGSNAEFRLHAPFRGPNRFGDVQAATVDPVEHAAALRVQSARWVRDHYIDRTRNAERLIAEGAIGAAGYAQAIAEGRARFEAATADITF